MKRLIALASLGLASMAIGSRDEGRRFDIRCIEERDGARHVLYSAVVEGPPATDFRVVMRDARHEIEATFVNEPIAGGGIDARVHLRSRRAYGTSRNGLPLWEEDVQQHRLRVDGDQQIELLPFGAAGAAGLLELEVAPHDLAVAGPLGIRIGQQMASGAIRVDACRAPHWFHASAEIASAGRVIARGDGRLFVDESGKVALRDDTGAQVAELHLTPSSVPYENRWRAASATVDGAWTRHGTSTTFARGWSGAGPTGQPMRYDIGNGNTLSITVEPEGAPS